uniref:Uncharacterized protein n=1 Tax=Sphaerodactylus townsendi TaxID=933632 RepID=A0ACB8G5D7_9SAUR
MLGNQDVGTAAATAPCEQAPILVKEPQTSGKAKQGNLVSNQDTCGIASNGAVPAKSKVKTCLPADCTFGRITVTLDNNTMWNKFYHRNTEMILTKQGRRMFPYCRYWITGLESSLKYILVMDISPVDNFHYKWNGHSWEPSEKAEPHVWGRVFIHPESPSTGHYWMHQPVSFYKLKLTNNTLDQEGHIILHSMHRYLPRLHLVPAEKGTDIIQLNSSDVHTFTFPQTEFFAVTAYQNIQITQLKIDCNPFAKGFVKGGLKSSDQYKAKQNGRSEHEGFPHNDRCTYSPDADVLDPGQRGLNSSYDNQKMCNTDLERKPFNSCINEHDGPELKQETTELRRKLSKNVTSNDSMLLTITWKWTVGLVIFPIAYPFESDSDVKSLLISKGDINVSIKEELVDDWGYVPNIDMERIQLKQKDVDRETKDFSCSDNDPILEKQLKKHSKIEEREVEIKSHKQSYNSLLGVAKTKMLTLDNGTTPTASVDTCMINKSMAKVSALQAILTSFRTDKSFLRHSENSFPAHFENIVGPATVAETKVKAPFSGDSEEKQSCLVEDVPQGNIRTHKSHAIKQNPSNFRWMSSAAAAAAAKTVIGGKRPNTGKKPALSANADSNPRALLSGPRKRGRPRKLKLSEVTQPLKAILKNHCAPLSPYSDHPEFMLDLEDVGGFLFVSSGSKEGLSNHTVDKSGRTEEPQNEQAALQITCDSVGLKLGSVDPTDSIDLQYLGVLLPLSSSKDRAFGNNQGIRPSSLGSILESSLKNQSAFYSDKLDEYLESEGKRMNTSMGFSASISSYPVPHQFSSESSNYIKTQHSILKKKCTPLASYCFKPFSLPSFRKGRRNITSKQASTRGSIRSNNSAVPSPVLSKEQHRFQVLKNKVTNPQPDSKMDNIGTVLMMPNLDENVQGKQRTVCQSMQNSHICNPSTKLIKLEGCALQNGKPRTYITEEHADFSLPLLNNCKVIGRQTAQCSSSSCQPGCVCASSPLEEFQPTLCSETECTFECLKKKMILTKGISIQKPLHGILTCCNGQEEEWKLEQTNKGETTCDDFYKADLKQSSINFPVWVKEEETDTKPIDIPTSSKSTKHVMLPHSEVILPFSKLNPTCEVVKVEQGKTPNFKSMFPEQKNVVSSIIQPTASLVREVGAVHLEERKSHIQGTHTTSMELEVTASNSKAEELLVTQPKSQGTMYEKNAITSGIAGKNTEMMEQLSSFDPVFQLETVLADHSYFLKDTAETQQHVKLSEGTLDDISQSVHSKQSELSNNQPVDAARAVTRDRSKHTEDERCRRKEMKGLFEKLQVTLQSQSYPRVANRVLLENAFEEIRGLTNQADQLMEQKKLLMCKQDILIRKASALSGKTQEIVLKKLQYTNAKQKSGEAQKMHQQQKNQPMKAIEISETARPYVQDGPNTNALVQGHPANEDSFLMPRIVNVMSFATEEDSDLNLEINRDSYVSLVTDSQAWKPSFPVVSEEINVHYVKKPDSSGEKEKDATGTIKHFIGKKEISFSQMVEVSSLKGSSESLVTKLGIEELTQSQAKEKQTDKGGGGEGRQWSQYSSFQALQVKGRKTLGTEIELQKVASAIQEAAPDASDLVAMEENDETDGILTSLLNEIVFLNHQLNDDASDVAKLPNSLSSCLSLGVTENQRESSTANGSSFQFDALRGSLKNLCLVQESCGCITPLMLHLESDGIADCDRTLRQPPSKPDVLKLMLGSEVKDPDLDFLIVNTDGSVKHMAPLSKTTHMSLPVLKMKTNLESGKVDTVWKPMPKLAPFGLKPASFPLDSVGQITKVMSLLAPVTAEMSSVGLEATQSVTSQEQD